MHRFAIRLCVFFLSLSILAVVTPSDANAQMCVRYARMLTSFNIQGDAWSWWQNSAGRYSHGIRPVAGSVLVFRRTGHLQYGHVSTVSRVIDRRTILVDHSWLEGDTLHRGMKVVDTSPNNSWSSVRVWYEPGDNLGLRTYPTFGFIYPHGGKGMDETLTVAASGTDADGDHDGTVARGPRSRTTASSLRVASVFLPHHKPAMMVASAAPVPAAATTTTTPFNPADFVTAAGPVTATAPAAATAPAVTGVVLAFAPRHKPERAGTAAQAPAVEFTEVPQVVVPRHKPTGHGGHGGNQVADAGGAASEIGD